MPIFEYVCQDCRQRFEALVYGGRQPECPACHGSKLEQQLSVFSVNTKSPAAAGAGPCGSCGDPRGPGSCSFN